MLRCKLYHGTLFVGDVTLCYLYHLSRSGIRIFNRCITLCECELKLHIGHLTENTRIIVCIGKIHDPDLHRSFCDIFADRISLSKESLIQHGQFILCNSIRAVIHFFQRFICSVFLADAEFVRPGHIACPSYSIFCDSLC